MTYVQLAQLAGECGFTAWSPLDVARISLRSEVRDMCATNTCGKYAKCWSCPPGCGTLEECEARLKAHSFGILVQTTGDMEDSFDFASVMEIERRHKQNFRRMFDALRARREAVLALGAGCCTQCANCSYPDQPCRFPDQMISSMEAYGMLVLDVCKANGLQYYYGSNKMSYTSCFLL